MKQETEDELVPSDGLARDDEGQREFDRVVKRNRVNGCPSVTAQAL